VLLRYEAPGEPRRYGAAERRTTSRLSARRKTEIEIVLRVLGGEDVDALSSELRIEDVTSGRMRRG